MIDHVTIYVNDLLKSKSFYEKVFVPFDYKISFGDEEIFGHLISGTKPFSKLLNIKIARN